MSWERRPRAGYPSQICANETVEGEIDISLRAVSDRAMAKHGALWDFQYESNSIFHIMQVLIRLHNTLQPFITKYVQMHNLTSVARRGHL